MRIDHIFPQPGLKALNLELITRGFHCSIILFVPVGGVGVDGPGGVTGEEIGVILVLCICICIVTSSKF